MPLSFLQSLAALAKVTGRDLPPEAFELYDQFVAVPYGEAPAQQALQQFVISARGFPAPGELIALIEGPKLNTKQLAMETASRMMAAVPRRGYTWADTYRYDHPTFEAALTAECGDGAIEVVNICGGWKAFCQQYDEGTNSNARAQLRDLLENIQIRRKQTGNHHPSLEAARPKTGLTRAGHTEPTPTQLDAARAEAREWLAGVDSGGAAISPGTEIAGSSVRR